MQRLIIGLITVLGLWSGETVLAQNSPENSTNDPFRWENIKPVLPCNTEVWLNCWYDIQLLDVLEGHNTAISSVTFTPDSETIISGGSLNDAHIRLWDTYTGKLLKDLRAQRTRVTSVTVTQDGRKVITTGGDAKITIWDLDQREKERIFLEQTSNILALAVTPNSEVLVSGGMDGLYVWDLRTNRPIYTLARFEATYALAMHPDGHLFASGGQDGTIKLWNVQTGTLVSAFAGHSGKVRSLSFTPDGATLISGGEDRKVKLWDSTTQQLLHTLEGHTGRIMAIASHPSNQLFATSSRDGVRIWDRYTGALINHFTAHDDWVQALAFSPDGIFLATGGFDRTVKLWEGIFPEDLIPPGGFEGNN